MALMHTYAHWNTTYHHAKAHDHTYTNTQTPTVYPSPTLLMQCLDPLSIYIYIIVYIYRYEKEQWTFERVVIIGQRCVCVCLFACLFVCVCVRAHSVGTIFATTRGFRQLTRLIPIELHFAYSVFVARPPKKSNLSWCELDLVRSVY